MKSKKLDRSRLALFVALPTSLSAYGQQPIHNLLVGLIGPLVGLEFLLNGYSPVLPEFTGNGLTVCAYVFASSGTYRQTATYESM